MALQTLLQQLINGLILGSVYALVALGYTMVYGILGLINFAHGDILMIGALTAFSALHLLHRIGIDGALALLLATLMAMAMCVLLSLLMERFAYRPLRHAPRLAPLITAIGLSMLLQTLAMIIWGRSYLVFPSTLSNTPLDFFGATITPVQIMILLGSVSLMLLLLWLIHASRLGRAMRATAENPRMAALLGVNTQHVIMLTFALGGGLAAIAGVMVAANYSIAHFYMGFMLGLKAFVAAVLGGIGNLTGAMVGGLLLGLIEVFGAGYIGDLTNGMLGSQYQDIFAFLVLILVLTFRPSGLMGERLADRA